MHGFWILAWSFTDELEKDGDGRIEFTNVYPQRITTKAKMCRTAAKVEESRKRVWKKKLK